MKSRYLVKRNSDGQFFTGGYKLSSPKIPTWGSKSEAHPYTFDEIERLEDERVFDCDECDFIKVKTLYGVYEKGRGVFQVFPWWSGEVEFEGSIEACKAWIDIDSEGLIETSW